MKGYHIVSIVLLVCAAIAGCTTPEAEAPITQIQHTYQGSQMPQDQVATFEIGPDVRIISVAGYPIAENCTIVEAIPGKVTIVAEFFQRGQSLQGTAGLYYRTPHMVSEKPLTVELEATKGSRYTIVGKNYEPAVVPGSAGIEVTDTTTGNIVTSARGRVELR